MVLDGTSAIRKIGVIILTLNQHSDGRQPTLQQRTVTGRMPFPNFIMGLKVYIIWQYFGRICKRTDSNSMKWQYFQWKLKVFVWKLTVFLWKHTTRLCGHGGFQRFPYTSFRNWMNVSHICSPLKTSRVLYEIWQHAFVALLNLCICPFYLLFVELKSREIRNLLNKIYLKI